MPETRPATRPPIVAAAQPVREAASESPLNLSVSKLWGVGPERAAQLARLDVFTVDDLLLHRPSRHEDRRHLKTIRELELGRPATVHGQVVALGVKYYA